MNRKEKIRLIKGLMMGTIKLKELSEREVEVWIQVIGTDSYKHFKTGETCNKNDLLRVEKINRQIIMMDFVSGKTIL